MAEGWALFNPDGQAMLNELRQRKLIKAFNFNGAYNYSGMLQDQIEGNNDSWAVRWYTSAFLAGKLTLYPGRSLVHNIGNDSSGSHCGTSTELDVHLSDQPIQFKGIKAEVSKVAQKEIERFFRRKRAPVKRILSLLLSHGLQSKLSWLARDWLPPILVRQLRRVLRSGGYALKEIIRPGRKQLHRQQVMTTKNPCQGSRCNTKS